MTSLAVDALSLARLVLVSPCFAFYAAGGIFFILIKSFLAFLLHFVLPFTEVTSLAVDALTLAILVLIHPYFAFFAVALTFQILVVSSWAQYAPLFSTWQRLVFTGRTTVALNLSRGILPLSRFTLDATLLPFFVLVLTRAALVTRADVILGVFAGFQEFAYVTLFAVR